MAAAISHQAIGDGEGNHMGSVARARFQTDMVDVPLHRTGRNSQLLGHLLG